MENCVISRVHSVSNVVLESRSSKCQSLRGLVDCRQQRNVECYKLKSISDRRHTLSKQWTSSTVYSSRLRLPKERRITTSALGADDAEVPISRVTRKHRGWILSDNLSNAFKADKLGTDISMIALPAMVALAADPLASLVDTAFIGRIGPVELAAVGVSISVFNLTSKMFNVPLLNVTTSIVAEGATKKLLSQEADPTTSVSADPILKEKLFLPAISSALVLACVLGVGQALILTFLARPVLKMMGVAVTSPMRTPAVDYLVLRGLGAPAVVIALAVQGVFRGFKDTKTPLRATVAGNIVNVVLDPILMFSCSLGVRGAAVATVVSQYVIAGLMLWNLNKLVVLIPNRWEDLSFKRFLTSGGFLLGRSISLIFVFTLATSMAARQGPIAMAAHQICLQIWLAISLLSDSVALAGQSIVASAFARKDYKLVKEAVNRVIQIGCALGSFWALVIAFGMPSFSRLFTNDESVLHIVRLLLPYVAVTQPINALAFILDGLHYGASDFKYSAISTMALAVPSKCLLLILPKYIGIHAVWVGFTTIMSLRMLSGLWRIKSRTGPWQFWNRVAV